MGLLLGLWAFMSGICMAALFLGNTLTIFFIPLVLGLLLAFPMASHIHQSERIDELEKQLGRMEKKLDQLLENRPNE